MALTGSALQLSAASSRRCLQGGASTDCKPAGPVWELLDAVGLESLMSVFLRHCFYRGALGITCSRPSFSRLFEPLGQFLVFHSEFEHPLLGLWIVEGLGSGQDFFRACSRVPRE
jgi:hypothetical protein